MSRRKETKNLSNEQTLGNKKAILAALAKASEDSLFLKETTSTFDGKPQQNYYILSQDEMAALVNGNMGIIESWISNMDRNHATQLLSRLIKERW